MELVSEIKFSGSASRVSDKFLVETQSMLNLGIYSGRYNVPRTKKNLLLPVKYSPTLINH